MLLTMATIRVRIVNQHGNKSFMNFVSGTGQCTMYPGTWGKVIPMYEVIAEEIIAEEVSASETKSQSVQRLEVQSGRKLEVRCQLGENKGANVVTCNSGDLWEYEGSVPSCWGPGKCGLS